MQEYSAMFHILNASIKASEQETTQIYLTSYKILSSSKLLKFKCLKVLLKILICFKILISKTEGQFTFVLLSSAKPGVSVSGG